MAKLPSPLQKCCQNNAWMLWCCIVLADSMRFEEARSSKVAIFGLWIGPNSALGWRKSLRRVAKKKRKKSNNLAWFYYIHTKYMLSTEYNYKGKLSSDPKITRLVLRKLLKSSYFFFKRGGRLIFFTVQRKLQPPTPQYIFLGNLYLLHDRVGRFIQISDRGA